MSSSKKTKKELLEELEELKDKLYTYEKNAKEHDYEQSRLYHLASFPELNPNPIIEIDEAKTITYCNEASFEIFKKLNISQDLYLFLPDDIDFMIQELCNGKNNSYIREKIICSRIFEEHIYLTAKRKTIRIYISDVTEVKTSEKNLLQTKQLLEKITNTSPAIISVFDIKSERNIYQNRSLLYTLGYTDEEVHDIQNKPANNILQTIHPDDIPSVEQFYENINAIQDGENYEMEFRILDKNNKWQWIRRVYSIFSRDEKGYPSQLVSIFENINDRKKAEENLKESEASLLQAQTLAKLGHYEYDVNTKKVHWSPETFKIIGCEHLTEAPPFEEYWNYIHPDDVDLVRSTNYNAIRDKKNYKYEYRIIHKTEGIKYIQSAGRPLCDINGNVVKIFGTIMDITERRKADETNRINAERFRVALQNSPIIVFNQDKDLKYTWIYNPAGGYNPNEIIGKTDYDLVPFDEAEELSEIKREVLNTGKAKKGEFWLHIGNNYNCFALTVEPLFNLKNEIDGITCSTIDISERKRYELELKENEETSRALLNTISETVLMLDVNGSILLLNDTAAKRLGKSKEDLIGKNVYDCFPEELARHRKAKVNTVLNTKNPIRFYDNREGYYFDTTIYPVIEPTGKINKVIIFGKDVTEAKLAEEKIKESEERYRNLIETSPEALIVHSEGIIIFANEAAAELVKAERAEDLLGKEVMSFLHPDYIDNVKERLTDITAKRKKVPAIEEKFICVDGTVIDVEVTAIPITVRGKSAIQVLAHDITEKKKVLNFLRESELKHKTLFESANDAIFLLKDNVFIDCNTKALKMFNCKREDIIDKTPFHFSPQLQPDGSNSEKKVNEVINKAYKGTVQFYEWRHVRKDGTTFDVEVSLNRIKLGGIPYIQKIVRDITERKQSEKALRETTLLLEKIAATSPAIIAVYDIKSNKNIYQNKSLLESLGYGNDVFKKYLDQKLDKNSLIHKDDIKILDKEFQNIRTLKDGESYSIEYRIKDAFGKWNWIRKVYSVFHRNEEGLPAQVVSIFENITNRKESEIALKISEEFNRAINEHSPLGISVRSKYGRLISYNNAWKKFWNKTDKEILADTTRVRKKLTFEKHDKYLAGWAKDVERIYTEGGTLYIPELKVNTSKSGIKWLSNYFYAIKDAEGKVDRVVILTEDITERKLAEEALNESQRKLVTLMSNLPGMAYRCKNDKSWTMEFASEGSFELTGYKADDLIDDKIIDYAALIHADDKEMVWQVIQKALNNKEGFELIYRIITFDNKEKWVWEKGQGVYNELGELVALEGFITDISERKKAEEQLRKLYQGVQQSPASIIITDLMGNIEYVNPSFTNTTGYTAEEVYGNNPRLLKSGYTKDEEYRNMWEMISNGSEWRGEFHNKKKNGELFWETASISPIKDESGKTTHFLAVKEDITEQKLKDEKLLSSLKEKEVMLREIHHRVKNNLQIISSLLKLQSAYIKDPVSYDYFTISQNRVKSMALIHQQLYRSTDLSQINFGNYIEKLTSHLINAYGIDNKQIAFNIEADEVYFEIDTAIPCGLLINELISNSLKHAFPFNRTGNINIYLHLDEENSYNLIVKDDGIGLPDGFDYKNTTSLGMQLVVTLTEQLDGKITVNNNNGTEFHIKFSKPLYIKRV